MHSTTVRRLARLLPVVFAAVIAASVPSTAHAASGCPGAGSTPAELGAPAVRTTTLCLLNGKRRANGLRSLRQATKLVRAAQRHSRDMVAHSYFAHDSRSGAAFSARIAKTGWMSGRDSWVVGENLAWGGGSNVDAAADRGDVDGKPRAPREHSQGALPRDRHRRRQRRARCKWWCRRDVHHGFRFVRTSERVRSSSLFALSARSLPRASDLGTARRMIDGGTVRWKISSLGSMRRCC